MSDTLGQQVADITGYESIAELDRLMDSLAEQGIAMHGIRTEQSIGKIAVNGILPNCPDVYPPASFWTSGRRIFFSNSNENPVNTFDTSFFHWSHSKNTRMNTTVMNFALSTKAAIQEIDPDLDDHAFSSGYFTVRRTVPPDDLQLVSVILKKNESLSSRENGQLIERKALRKLLEISKTGIRLGTHETVKENF